MLLSEYSLMVPHPLVMFLLPVLLLLSLLVVGLVVYPVSMVPPVLAWAWRKMLNSGYSFAQLPDPSPLGFLHVVVLRSGGTNGVALTANHTRSTLGPPLHIAQQLCWDGRQNLNLKPSLNLNTLTSTKILYKHCK